ncbi:hypothetical protein [Hyphobacterium sp.]|uniref:hypothetical protein n=1 Tax=Hyphobacterium sp. TaxID=2004662 RepID=UPI0037492867
MRVFSKNYKPKDGTRFADEQEAIEKLIQHTQGEKAEVELENSFSASLRGGLANLVSGRADSGTKKNVKKQGIKKQKLNKARRNVVALSNETWKIEEFGGEILEGRKLGNENICEMVSEGEVGGNIHTELIVRPGWIKVVELYKKNKLIPVEITDRNKLKVIEMLIARSVRQEAAQVIIATSQVKIETKDD